MKTTDAQMRKLIANNRPKMNTIGFPKEVKARVTAYLTAERKGGRIVADLAHALGISENSVERWTESKKTMKTKAKKSNGHARAVDTVQRLAGALDFVTDERPEMREVASDVRVRLMLADQPEMDIVRELKASGRPLSEIVSLLCAAKASVGR